MYVLIKYQGKTKRKVMNLLEEVAVLNKFERRNRTAAIICHYSVNNVTNHRTAAIIYHYSVNNVTIHFINPH